MAGRADVDEIELIELAQRGGEVGRRAFEQLVTDHRQWLVRLLVSLVGPSLAEDTAQEAFVRAYLAIARFRRGQSFRAWLRVIAIRLAYNVRRDRETRARYHAAYEANPRPPSPSADELNSERDALLDALARVSYPYREVLVLRYLEELSIDEIAKLLKIGASATKMRLHRARDELRRHYEVDPNHA